MAPNAAGWVATAFLELVPCLLGQAPPSCGQSFPAEQRPALEHRPLPLTHVTARALRVHDRQA